MLMKLMLEVGIFVLTHCTYFESADDATVLYDLALVFCSRTSVSLGQKGGKTCTCKSWQACLGDASRQLAGIDLAVADIF